MRFSILLLLWYEILTLSTILCLAICCESQLLWFAEILFRFSHSTWRSPGDRDTKAEIKSMLSVSKVFFFFWRCAQVDSKQVFIYKFFFPLKSIYYYFFEEENGWFMYCRRTLFLVPSCNTTNSGSNHVWKTKTKKNCIHKLFWPETSQSIFLKNSLYLFTYLFFKINLGRLRRDWQRIY